VEIQRQDFHFPTGSIFLFKDQRKEAWRPGRFAPGSPGSFWDEKMLAGAPSTPIAQPNLTSKANLQIPDRRSTGAGAGCGKGAPCERLLPRAAQ